MNHKAIDAGATAYKKFDVPADWADAKDQPDTTVLEGKPELVEQVKTILNPVGKMDGDSLPVSAFVKHVDGQFTFTFCKYSKTEGSHREMCIRDRSSTVRVVQKYLSDYKKETIL